MIYAAYVSTIRIFTYSYVYVVFTILKIDVVVKYSQNAIKIQSSTI